jgi:Fur family ferric uptake transcriptional regulator
MKTTSASSKTFLTSRIRDAGLKLTPARLQILELLEKDHCLLTIDEISKRLKKTDWATVYRTMMSFEDKKLVISSKLGDGTIRYEYCAPDDEHDHHHHHVMCKSCHSIKPLDHCGIEAIEKMIKKMGFSNITHHLEFSGICKECRK